MSEIRLDRRLLYVTLLVFAAVSMVYTDQVVANWARDIGFSRSIRCLLNVIRLPGNYFFTIGLAMVLYRWGRGPAIEVIVLLMSGAVAGCAVALLKFCFGRMRPFRGVGPHDWQPFALFTGPGHSFINPSFPSGDTALAFATAAIFSTIKPQWRWAGYLWAIAVAVSRVLQRAHYASDVAIGVIVGLAGADCCRRYWRQRLLLRFPALGNESSTRRSG